MKTEDPKRSRFFRDQRLGGYCFSDRHHQWPVSDCTAEALSALAYLARELPEAELPTPELLRAAVHFVLSRQNPDGGWGSYERQRGATFLRHFNPAEMFGNCMIEYSYVECTASCMVGLVHARRSFGEYLEPTDLADIEKALSQGETLLRHSQEAAGGWQGFWGVNYTYGTLFGVNGLLAAGATTDDPAIQKAAQWLLEHQHPEGGWGESYLGVQEERYVEHEHSQVIMTSWALMTLHKSEVTGARYDEAINRGIALLLARQREDGSWPREGVAGAFFNTAMHHYCLYKDYFSVWALSLHADRLSRDV
jgi:lanosterol synthase